jgi:Fur family ferric uptake transcriptional regulator
MKIDIKELFKKNEIKNTNQRKEVFKILMDNEIPITAEQIFIKLKKIKKDISLSTIYRILELFLDKELILKTILSDEKKAMFELNKKEHKHHLICIKCKKILPIDNCPLDEYEKLLEKKTNYRIKTHKLEILGYCPLCKEKEICKNENKD